MNIVVLDGYALNPGDLSWQAIEALGQCTVYDRTPEDQIVERAGDAEIVLTNKTVLTANILKQLKALRYISVLATGYNCVDVDAAAQLGIAVSNVPAYSTHSVAQLVFSHLLNLTHNVGDHARTVEQGKWYKAPDYCYWDHPLIELNGMTMGIIGLGRIGLATAQIALAFGMRVIAYTRTPKKVDGIDCVNLETVFKQADALTLHCPLTEDTQQIVNADTLALMKKTAFVINTSRGPLIDEAALAQALNKNRLAGAGLDVLSSEPPINPNPLIGAKNCFITPHIAWATYSARKRLMDVTIENITSYQAGSPQNQVN